FSSLVRGPLLAPSGVLPLKKALQGFETGFARLFRWARHLFARSSSRASYHVTISNRSDKRHAYVLLAIRRDDRHLNGSHVRGHVPEHLCDGAYPLERDALLDDLRDGRGYGDRHAELHAEYVPQQGGECRYLRRQRGRF